MTSVPRERICARCGLGFRMPGKRRYCSERCAMTARREQEANRLRNMSVGLKACAWCGRDFNAHPKLRMTYCSVQCRANDQLAAKSQPIPWLRCPTCRCWFVSRSERRRYCSVVCRPERTWVPRTGTPRQLKCSVCAQPFTWLATVGSPPRFCSQPCRAHAAQAHHLKAKAIRRAREAAPDAESFTSTEIFTRDRYVCQLCGRRTLRSVHVPHLQAPTVDHIVPLSRGGEHTRANTQCACFGCNTSKGNRVAANGEQLKLIG